MSKVYEDVYSLDNSRRQSLDAGNVADPESIDAPMALRIVQMVMSEPTRDPDDDDE